MRYIFILLLSVVAAAKMFADDPAWIPVDRSDDRVAVELHFELNSDALPEREHVVLFLIPSVSATKEEKKKNRGFEQGAVGPFKDAPGWGYSVAVSSRPSDVSVEVSTFSVGRYATIEREASFHVEYFADTKGERAGISFDMKWKKKPNQASEPTATSGRGSP